MSDQALSIAQVSPHPWGRRHEINEFVARTSAELAQRGHRALIVAPSDSRREIRESRRVIREAQADPESVWRGGNPRVIAIGQSIPLPSGPRRRPAPLPLDISRAMEHLLGAVPLDVVHVHEPFAPSTGSAALRHSQSLNVATFHEPVERVLSTQVARMLVEVFFGRIDQRLASNEATGELLQRFFPGQYQLIRPGADVAEPALDPPPPGRVRIVHCAEEERGALRLLLRALRRLPEDLDWEGVIWFDGPTDPLARVSRRLRERLRVVRPRDGEPAEFLAGADIVCLASGGVRAAPGLVRKALAAGAVPVVSDLELYRELVGDGERGPPLPARRRADADRPARAPWPRRGAPRGASRGRPCLGRGTALVRGDGRRRVRVQAARRQAPRRRRQPGDPRPAPRPGVHPLRPPYAHRSLARLRDPRGAAARDREGAGARGDRDHRPQRDLGGARSARGRRADRRDQGDRGRGGEDGPSGGGDRPLPLAADRTRDVDEGDHRRDQAAGRSGLRPASLRPASLGPRLRAPARDRRRDRHPRGLQSPRRLLRLQRGGCPLRSQVLDRPRAPGRTATWRRDSAASRSG